MKKFFAVLLAINSLSSFAFDLSQTELKLGQLANYYHFGLMERVVGKVTKVFADGKVEITAGESVVKNIKNVGFQIEDGCLEDICVGDRARYFHAELLETFTGKVSAVYDNGYVQVSHGSGFTLKKISNVSKVINN